MGSFLVSLCLFIAALVTRCIMPKARELEQLRNDTDSWLLLTSDLIKANFSTFFPPFDRPVWFLVGFRSSFYILITWDLSSWRANLPQNDRRKRSLNMATTYWNRTWRNVKKFANRWRILSSIRKESVSFHLVLISQRIARESLTGCGGNSVFKVGSSPPGGGAL